MQTDFDIIRRVLLQASPMPDASARPIKAQVSRVEVCLGEFLLRAGARATNALLVKFCFGQTSSCILALHSE